MHATIDAHIAHNDQLSEAQKTSLRAESTTVTSLLDRLGSADDAYQHWLRSALVGVRAELRVANYLADEAHKEIDGTLRPRRDVLASFVSGGLAGVFANKPLSAVLRAGHERTARFAHGVATTLGGLPETVGAQIPGLAPLVARAETVATRLDALLTRRDRELAPQRAPLAAAVDRAIFELRDGLALMDARLRGGFSPAFIESLYPELSRGGDRMRLAAVDATERSDAQARARAGADAKARADAKAKAYADADAKAKAYANADARCRRRALRRRAPAGDIALRPQHAMQRPLDLFEPRGELRVDVGHIPKGESHFERRAHFVRASERIEVARIPIAPL